MIAKTKKRQLRLKKIREATETVECMLLELKKYGDEESVVFIPPINDALGCLYYLQNIAKEGA